MSKLCFFQRKHKHVFSFYIISWHDTGSWNPPSCMGMTYLFYIINIMGTDVSLRRQGTSNCDIPYDFCSMISGAWLEYTETTTGRYMQWFYHAKLCKWAATPCIRLYAQQAASVCFSELEWYDRICGARTICWVVVNSHLCVCFGVKWNVYTVFMSYLCGWGTFFMLIILNGDPWVKIARQFIIQISKSIAL